MKLCDLARMLMIQEPPALSLPSIPSIPLDSNSSFQFKYQSCSAKLHIISSNKDIKLKFQKTLIREYKKSI